MNPENKQEPAAELRLFTARIDENGLKVWLDKSAAPGSWDFFLKAHAIVPLILGIFVFVMAVTLPSSASNSGRALLILLGIILTAFGAFAVFAWWIVETGRAGRFLLITDNELCVQYGLILDNEENKRHYPLSKIKAFHVKEIPPEDSSKSGGKPTYGLIIELENEFKAIWQFANQEEAEEIKNYLKTKINR